MVHTAALVDGSYLQLPTDVLNFGQSASGGTGTIISTLLAVDLLLNWLFACIKYMLAIIHKLSYNVHLFGHSIIRTIFYSIFVIENVFLLFQFWPCVCIPSCIYQIILLLFPVYAV